MKALNFNKIFIVIVISFVCCMTINAISPREYMYDTKEENGKITSKVAFLNDNGLLNKEFKYEFSYNTNGKVSEKKVYRWNGNSDEWKPYYQSTFTYDEANGEINTKYGMWNEKSKNFDLNIQYMVIPASNYADIFK